MKKSEEILNTVSQCGVSSVEMKHVWQFEEVIPTPTPQCNKLY